MYFELKYATVHLFVVAYFQKKNNRSIIGRLIIVKNSFRNRLYNVVEQRLAIQ